MLINTKDLQKAVNILSETGTKFVCFEIINNNTLMLYGKRYACYYSNPFDHAKFMIRCTRMTEEDMKYKKFFCNVRYLVDDINKFKSQEVYFSFYRHPLSRTTCIKIKENKGRMLSSIFLPASLFEPEPIDQPSKSEPLDPPPKSDPTEQLLELEFIAKYLIHTKSLLEAIEFDDSIPYDKQIIFTPNHDGTLRIEATCLDTYQITILRPLQASVSKTCDINVRSYITHHTMKEIAKYEKEVTLSFYCDHTRWYIYIAGCNFTVCFWGYMSKDVKKYKYFDLLFNQGQKCDCKDLFKALVKANRSLKRTGGRKICIRNDGGFIFDYDKKQQQRTHASFNIQFPRHVLLHPRGFDLKAIATMVKKYGYDVTTKILLPRDESRTVDFMLLFDNSHDKKKALVVTMLECM